MEPECKLLGENDNVFNLIGIVKKTLRRYNLQEELSRFDEDLKKIQESGGTYDDVLVLFMEYVDVAHSICELAGQDFELGGRNIGASGMSIEQIIRAAIDKKIEGFSYR